MIKHIKYLILVITMLASAWGTNALAGSVVIRGAISDNDGNPVKGQIVNAVVDGDTSIHINNLMTDSSGFYCDTVYTPDADGIVLVYTYDCDDQYHEQVHSFHGNSVIEAEFVICVIDKIQCDADFFFVKDSTNNLAFSFYNNSIATSSIVTYQWTFGDNTSSTMINPTHIYADTGTYNVQLNIWTANGCHSSYSDSIRVEIDTNQCVANYYFQKDTVSGLVNYYHFFNNSTPTDKIISYHWDFDDGNYSNAENPSHQFKKKGTYNVELTVTTSFNCTSTYTHRIVINQDFLGTCAADFDFYADTATNINSYHFTDQSTSVGSPIISHYWSFGDGNYSVNQNPDHIFPGIGAYKVALTVFTQDSCMSTVEKTVTVGNPSYYLLGGQVFYNSLPIDTFNVILFRDINSYLQPVDTARFDTLGYFYFIDIIEGDYKVKIMPTANSSYALNSTPTYYDHHLFWDVSQNINLNAHTFSADVDMIMLNQSNGSGVVNGLLYYDNSTSTSYSYPPGSSPVLENKEIYVLEKATGNPVRFTRTAPDGSFSIDNIPYGTYEVYADYPGKYCQAVDVTISANNTVIDSVKLKISDDQISGVVIDKIDNPAIIGEAYPNPSRDIFNLPVKLLSATDVELSVQTINGQEVFHAHRQLMPGKQNLKLDLSGLEKGIYLLNVKTSDNQANSRQKLIIL